MPAEKFDIWGPKAFNALADKGHIISPSFCLALDNYWEFFADGQRGRPEHDNVVEAAERQYNWLGISPRVGGYKPLTRQLLVAADKNNPVDAFMFCNAVILTDEPRLFSLDPANVKYDVSYDLAVRGMQRKVLTMVVESPQYANTQLAHAAQAGLDAHNHYGSHLSFIPSLKPLKLHTAHPSYGSI